MDDAAEKIGALYRKALGALDMETNEGTVTLKRNFSEEVSDSRNAVEGKLPSPKLCCHCLKPFSQGQVRYPIMHWVIDWDDLEKEPRNPIAPLCAECFEARLQHLARKVAQVGGKRENILGVPGSPWYQQVGFDCDLNPAPRHDAECKGCGEPIHTIAYPRHRHWLFCSNRCYQRDYRKRRRGCDSVVAWKAHRPHSNCAVCHKSLDKFGEPNKRKDALYCSSKCRQWAYRRRHQ